MSSLYYVEDNLVHEKPINNYLKSNGLEFANSIVFDSFIGTASNSSLLPNWWTTNRDKSLKQYALSTDLLASVLNILTIKLAHLEWKIVPRNSLIKAHQDLANTYDSLLRYSWHRDSQLFIQDVLATDSGGYFVVEGDRSISQPFQEGDTPTGIKYIPSTKILFNRNDANLPYTWIKDNGNGIKIHKTRMIRMLQLPQQVSENVIIGYSFISRAFNAALLMNYAIQFGLETLGALDAARIIYGTGTTGQSIKQSFKEARIEADNQQRIRTSGNVYVGLRDAAGKVGILDLKKTPDNFNYEQYVSTTIKLLAIAAAEDEDTIAAASSAGSTRTAALIADLKQRGKLPYWFASTLAEEINQKFLPSELRMSFGDEHEVSETESKAFVTISRAYSALTKEGVYTPRSVRKNLLDMNKLTYDDFVEIELAEGRLPSGLAVQSLFLSKDTTFKKLLAIPNFDYCTCEFTDTTLIQPIKEKIMSIEEIAVNTISATVFDKARQSIAALRWLLHEIEENTKGKDAQEFNDDFDYDNENPDDFMGVSEDMEEMPEVMDELGEMQDSNDENAIPTTRAERKAYYKLRKLFRKQWMGQLTREELIYQMQLLGVNKKWAKTILSFFDNHDNMTRENGFLLKDIYSDLQEDVLNDYLTTL